MASFVKEGVLRKKRRNRSGANFLGKDVWQDRRFVLTYTKLQYGLRTSESFKDHIDMSNSTVVTPLENIEMPHAFKVETGSDNIFISCPSDLERTAWMDAIQSVTLGSVTSTAVKRSSLGLAAMQALTEGLTPEEVLQREAMKMKTDGNSPPRKRGASSTFDISGGLPSSQPPSSDQSTSSMVASAGISTATADVSPTYVNPTMFTDAEMDREELWALLQVSSHCCQKRFSTETVFKTRYIWVNESTQEFHWSKVPNDMDKSKYINIYDHVESVSINAIEGMDSPNFVIKFHADVSDSVWTSFTVLSAVKQAPSTIEICMNDPVICEGFVQLINELRVKTKENPIIVAKAAKRGTI